MVAILIMTKFSGLDRNNPLLLRLCHIVGWPQLAMATRASTGLGCFDFDILQCSCDLL